MCLGDTLGSFPCSICVMVALSVVLDLFNMFKIQTKNLDSIDLANNFLLFNFLCDRFQLIRSYDCFVIYSPGIFWFPGSKQLRVRYSVTWRVCPIPCFSFFGQHLPLYLLGNLNVAFRPIPDLIHLNSMQSMSVNDLSLSRNYFNYVSLIFSDRFLCFTISTADNLFNN